MTFFTHLFGSSLQSSKSFFNIAPTNLAFLRHASKKASSSTRNKPDHRRPKHRGWKVQDGHYVQKGTLLATQLNPRFHPGLYVGWGKNCTLYALESGRVVVTCEQINPNLNHLWGKLCYAGRENNVIYKKHFNVIPDKQHDKFVLVDVV